jgi:prepilin-type N-terminal cleavage/methylation domain-containing protein
MLQIRHKSSGFTIIEVMIGVAILGIVAYAVVEFSNRMATYRSYIQFIHDRSHIRRSLIESVSCQQTLDTLISPTTGRVENCPNPATIVLRDANGVAIGTLASHPGFRNGYRFRARCEEGVFSVPSGGGRQQVTRALGLVIDAMIVESPTSTTAKRDPLRPNSRLDFAHPSTASIAATSTGSPLCTANFYSVPRAFEITIDYNNPPTSPAGFPTAVADALTAAAPTDGVNPPPTLEYDCANLHSNGGLWNGPQPFHGTKRAARFDRFCETFCTHDQGLNYSVGLWQHCGDDNNPSTPDIGPVPSQPISGLASTVTCLCIR